ncbi:hypothetical protein QE152_g36006 [Popillia japonica]|uniref:Uncharacterized protein n=1 Tax=Popillia japonica TaxID=7064 RepID=A0AAW1IEF8_POPJA
MPLMFKCACSVRGADKAFADKSSRSRYYFMCGIFAALCAVCYNNRHSNDHPNKWGNELIYFRRRANACRKCRDRDDVDVDVFASERIHPRLKRSVMSNGERRCSGDGGDDNGTIRYTKCNFRTLPQTTSASNDEARRNYNRIPPSHHNNANGDAEMGIPTEKRDITRNYNRIPPSHHNNANGDAEMGIPTEKRDITLPFTTVIIRYELRRSSL